MEHRQYCTNYDARPNSTKLLEKTIVSIADMIRASFVPSSTSTSQSKQQQLQQQSIESNTSGDDGNAITSNQPAASQIGFLYNGAWQPLCFMTAVVGTPKSHLLELIDKHEAPTLLDGYCVSMAHANLVDTMYSVHKCLGSESAEVSDAGRLLFASTNGGVHGGLSLLLEASTDENVSERLLHCVNMLLTCSCRLGVKVMRDACVMTLCRVALPNGYLAERLMPTLRDGQAVTQSNVVVVDAMGAHVVDQSNMSQVIATSVACPTLDHLTSVQVFVSISCMTW